jgi:peptide subunit release factor 1 (eRF1)
MVDPSSLPVLDEHAEILEDARRFRNKTPEERMAIFKDILDMISATWACLPEEEQRRRLRIGESLDPRPEPWWKNLRAEARP